MLSGLGESRAITCRKLKEIGVVSGIPKFTQRFYIALNRKKNVLKNFKLFYFEHALGKTKEYRTQPRIFGGGRGPPTPLLGGGVISGARP